MGGVLNGESQGFGGLFGMIEKQTYYQLNLGIVKPDKSGAAGDISHRTEPCLNNPPCNLCVCWCVRVFVTRMDREGRGLRESESACVPFLWSSMWD